MPCANQCADRAEAGSNRLPAHKIGNSTHERNAVVMKKLFFALIAAVVCTACSDIAGPAFDEGQHDPPAAATAPAVPVMSSTSTVPTDSTVQDLKQNDPKNPWTHFGGGAIGW